MLNSLYQLTDSQWEVVKKIVPDDRRRKHSLRLICEALFYLVKIGCQWRMLPPFYDEMHARLQTPKARKMKKLRQSTVEPVIGTLVNFLGMRRVNTRGIQLANKCLLMAAVCYNLKRLLKWIGETAPEGEKIPFEHFVALWLLVVQDSRECQLSTVVAN